MHGLSESVSHPDIAGMNEAVSSASGYNILFIQLWSLFNAKTLSIELGKMLNPHLVCVYACYMCTCMCL